MIEPQIALCFDKAFDVIQQHIHWTTCDVTIVIHVYEDHIREQAHGLAYTLLEDAHYNELQQTRDQHYSPDTDITFRDHDRLVTMKFPRWCSQPISNLNPTLTLTFIPYTENHDDYSDPILQQANEAVCDTRPNKLFQYPQ